MSETVINARKRTMSGISHCIVCGLCGWMCLFLSACYNNSPKTPDAWDLSDRQIDSISFSTTHHYSQNYNFVVKADSLLLLAMPSTPVPTDIGAAETSYELGDTITEQVYVYKRNHVVVADIQTIPADTIDSVWVKIARDQLTQGWIRESEMLPGVEPDDPISQFIDFFSDTHLLIFLAFCVLVLAAYGMRKLLRRNARIVHFNDIDSFYPTLLCILVAASATFYATIQLFGAEQWRHFYYHPSLNPFALPFYLGLFVASLWAMIIVAVAAFDDTIRLLPAGDAMLYFCGLAGICAVDYVVFSISTLYYVGYLLLIVYVCFALWRYFRYARCPYTCGRCGKNMREKGRCPHCGATNE